MADQDDVVVEIDLGFDEILEHGDVGEDGGDEGVRAGGEEHGWGEAFEAVLGLKGGEELGEAIRGVPRAMDEDEGWFGGWGCHLGVMSTLVGSCGGRWRRNGV